MSPTEWAGFGAGVCAVLTSLLVGLRFLIKGWLNELRPNGGSSLYDAISRIDEKSTRLEQRVDDLYSLIVKRQ